MRKYAVLLFTFMFLCACGKKESFAPEENTGVQLATNVSIFESKDSQKQWILTADAVDFSDLGSSTLKNPVLLLKQDGQDSARVTGNLGTFDYLKKQVTIEGNARIHSLTERVLITTERFFYDVNEDKIWSNTKTTITRDTAKAVARGGVVTDSKLTKIELKQQSTRVPKSKSELKK